MNPSSSWEDKVKSEWKARAKTWDMKSASMWDNGSRKEIIPFIQKHIKKGAKILDVGCASGYGTNKLHLAGYQAEGVDISEKMIELAKRRFPNVPFTTASIDKLPFSDQSYDAMMVVNVLEWTSHPYKAMVELKRVLKSNGYLCIGILGPTAGPRNHGYRRLYGENVIINTMMPWEFSQLATELGFEQIADFGVDKKETEGKDFSDLPKKLQQSLAFMWVFMLRNSKKVGN
ncbi:ubiquinone/menaquinone biosynthesis C-methylase UbiE [Cerasibacillus quisquiliarum]|uniref:Methyltransferase n=1 Tax=Cerasibacillus quisquiliarum TaxID=227865 RepID=A0A511UZE5_9BACI|nr:class I SAM-dependent methyltransferase [Cerasibacillus quisquiliarum]MBB5147200.1 ubiquinone/menaquinone biosynthesis C-methylase UbiE [Cerasibacillus quisquiliarum]GEN32014.1 methyltransferase [Cerasibacillus quisquiliarum]